MFSSRQPLQFTLKAFLETGRIGPLGVGTSLQEVLNWLGEPTGQTDPYPKRGRNKGSVVAFLYGCLELGFVDGRVEYLGFDFQSGRLPDLLVVHGYFPSPQITLDGLKAYLDEEHIPHRVHSPLTFGNQHTLAIGIGVIAIFIEPDRTLDSLYFSREGAA